MSVIFRKRQIAIGWRTWKTVISIIICMLLQHFFLPNSNRVILLLAAVLAMQTTSTESISFSKVRIFSNFLGAILAAIIIILFSFFGQHFLLEIIVIPLAVVCIIVVCALVDNKTGIAASVATFLAIVYTGSEASTIFVAGHRILDTIVGSLVAVSVNHFIMPRSQKAIEKLQQEQDDSLT